MAFNSLPKAANKPIKSNNDIAIEKTEIKTTGKLLYTNRRIMKTNIEATIVVVSTSLLCISTMAS